MRDLGLGGFARRHMVTLALALAAALIVPIPVSAATPTQPATARHVVTGVTTPVGVSPQSIGLDAATDTAYVANSVDDGTLSVIDTTTCNAVVADRCAGPAPTVAAGNNPVPTLVDPKTDTVYVGDFGDGTVSVIDGATCNAHVHVGCGQTPATISVGTYPTDLAFDADNDTLYVANFGDGTVSVINTATCNTTDRSGCGQRPTTISFGAVQPSGLLLDPNTHTLYVANLGTSLAGPGEPDTIAVLNTATCNATHAGGCISPAASITVGLASDNNNVALALDRASRTLYVANDIDNTISVVDIADCSAAVTSGCHQHAVTSPVVGGYTLALVAAPASRTLYEVEDGNNTVDLLDIATCNATRSTGCDHHAGTFRGGVNTNFAALDTTHGTLYVSSSPPNRAGDVSLIDAVRCTARDQSGCPTIPPAFAVGSVPDAIAVNDATHTAYIANSADGTVSVVDTHVCAATTVALCRHPRATIAVGNTPAGIGIDTASDTVYVTNYGSNTLSVIDGARCNARTTSDCGTPPPVVATGSGPLNVALDPGTHTAYVVDQNQNAVSVINTRHCNRNDHSGCGQTAPTVAVGDEPWDVIIEDTTHTAYVSNNADNTISVLDTRTCDAAQVTGCRATPPTLSGGEGPRGMALDPATRTVYVADSGDRTVAVLDASTCDAGHPTGCSQKPAFLNVGAFPDAVALDEAAQTVYVSNLLDNTVDEINAATISRAPFPNYRHRVIAVPVGNGPNAIAADPAAGTIYVVNGLEPGRDDDVSTLTRSAGQHARGLTGRTGRQHCDAERIGCPLTTSGRGAIRLTA